MKVFVVLFEDRYGENPKNIKKIFLTENEAQEYIKDVTTKFEDTLIPSEFRIEEFEVVG